MSPKITFVLESDPKNPKILNATPGELLTQCAYKAGVLIQQTCGGTPSCADCKIRVLEGANDAFEPIEGAETRLIGNVYFITSERLACQARVKSDCTIFVPNPPQRVEKVLRKHQSQYKNSKQTSESSKEGIDYGQQKEIKKIQEKGSAQKKEGRYQKEKTFKGKKS